MKSVSENGVTLTYTYDERGNVLTESDGTSVKSYTYNEFDGRASYTLKVNNVAIASETYAYDAARQLASVTTDSVQVTYGYDMNGNRITDRTINPTTGLEVSGHNYAFDGANRVVRVQGMVLANNGASLLLPVSETYTYNLDGSMSSKVDNATAVTTTYAYDGAGRLTYEIEGTAVTTYAYDAANNRTSMYKDGVTTTYTYDANNRLLSEVKGSQVTNYTYDANGNQLSGNGLITYDARGRQSTWTDGLTTASYTYYPTDLRKSKTVGATTTNFVWDGQNMVYEYKGTNTLGGTAYYYGLTLISQGNYAYYLYNGHGDVVQLVTASNTLGRSYDYDAFGNEVNPSATDTNPFRYAGQYFDSETGTYYLRARYYDPGIGRFTQQDGWTFADPSDPLSLNLYTYCWNDPNKYVDYSGKSPIPFIIAGALALLKVLDYGWTIWDVVDSAHTLSNPNSDDASKFFAAINIAMSTSFELLEPDDLLPASIPLDDAARKVTIKTIKNKLEKNGPVAVKNYLRKTFGSAAEAGIKYLDNYIDDTIETVGKWGQGSYDSIKDSLIDHFYRHGSEVGATDVNQYLRKAEAFAQNLRGAKKFPSNGYTPNAVRYVKNGKYIIMDGGLILSFGKDIID